MSEVITTRPVSVDELRRAWRALQDGTFRARTQPIPRPHRHVDAAASEWAPIEAVLPVVGCTGQSGASTLAVAIATVAAPARVLECASAASSGLASAATAELGSTGNGWTVGRREQVWLARVTEVLLGTNEVPVPDPAPPEVTLTVLDVGWDAGQVMAADSWVRDQILAAQTVIAVTTPTIPGLRRLETALTLLPANRALVAVVGAPRRRWPRQLTAAMGPLATAADTSDRLIIIPADKDLALRGLDSTSLPTALLKAAEMLLQRATAADHTRRDTPR